MSGTSRYEALADRYGARAGGFAGNAPGGDGAWSSATFAPTPIADLVERYLAALDAHRTAGGPERYGIAAGRSGAELTAAERALRAESAALAKAVRGGDAERTAA